jgi:hypothetical protein
MLNFNLNIDSHCFFFTYKMITVCDIIRKFAQVALGDQKWQFWMIPEQIF